jgi:hypothetical protein
MSNASCLAGPIKWVNPFRAAQADQRVAFGIEQVLDRNVVVGRAGPVAVILDAHCEKVLLDKQHMG